MPKAERLISPLRCASARTLLALLVAFAMTAPPAARALALPVPPGHAELEPDEPEEEPDEDGETPGDSEAPEQEDDESGEDDANEPDEDNEEEDAEQDEYLAIIGADVHTVSGPTLRGATVLTKNGVIHAIGPHVKVPDDAEVIDATGHRVYPGLVAIRSSSILGDAPLRDSTDVFSLSMNLALAGGVTTVGSGNAAGKLTFGTLDGLDLASDVFLELRYVTSNPKSRRDVRASLEKARQYERDLERYQREKADDPDVEKPDDAPTKGRDGEYLKLIRGQRTAIANANEAQDIIEIASLASEFGFKLVVRGGREAWTVAPQLARSGASVIVTPRARSAPDTSVNRATGSSIENASILHDHGVRMAIVPAQTGITLWGLGGQDLQHLPLEAAFAVRGGLPDHAAVRSITLDAAQILGVDHRVGSIEVGKDADLIVTDGDLLHYLTHVAYTIVNGRVVYTKAEDTLFNHIRPAGDADAPPPDDHWPRRLGDPL